MPFYFGKPANRRKHHLSELQFLNNSWPILCQAQDRAFVRECRSRAIARLCAVCTPNSRSMSAIRIRQSEGKAAVEVLFAELVVLSSCLRNTDSDG